MPLTYTLVYVSEMGPHLMSATTMTKCYRSAGLLSASHYMVARSG